MNKLFKMSLAGAMGLSALFTASSANALTTISCPGSAGSATCNFSDTAAIDDSGFFGDTIGGAASFDDVFQFVLNSAGDITFTLTNSPGRFTTISALFDGSPVSFGGPSLPTSFFKTAGTYDLRITGATNRTASFSGTADFTSAVPEPATWAMMIGGFAIMGVAMRRRQNGRRAGTAFA